MGELLQFSIPPKLGRGERPKRRTDADRVRDLDTPKGQTIAEFFDTPAESLIDFAKSGGPKESA
jgi:hypothetical protein